LKAKYFSSSYTRFNRLIVIMICHLVRLAVVAIVFLHHEPARRPPACARGLFTLRSLLTYYGLLHVFEAIRPLQSQVWIVADLGFSRGSRGGQRRASMPWSFLSDTSTETYAVFDTLSELPDLAKYHLCQRDHIDQDALVIMCMLVSNQCPQPKATNSCGDRKIS
jgi:hypothetical protein